MDQINMPLLGDMTYWFELPNGEFVKIDLNENANGDWVVEYHDHTNEFISGIQINPEKKISSTKQVASSKSNTEKWLEMFPPRENFSN